MTTAVQPDRQAQLDGQGDVLGPVATFGAQIYMWPSASFLRSRSPGSRFFLGLRRTLWLLGRSWSTLR